MTFFLNWSQRCHCIVRQQSQACTHALASATTVIYKHDLSQHFDLILNLTRSFLRR